MEAQIFQLLWVKQTSVPRRCIICKEKKTQLKMIALIDVISRASSMLFEKDLLQ
jgi:hypothetical protein